MEARRLDGMLNAIVKQYRHETPGVDLTRCKRRGGHVDDGRLSAVRINVASGGGSPRRIVMRTIGQGSDLGWIKTTLLAGGFLRMAPSAPIVTLSSESSGPTRKPDRS